MKRALLLFVPICFATGFSCDPRPQLSDLIGVAQDTLSAETAELETAMNGGGLDSAARTELVPGVHDFEVYGIDIWGNSGESIVNPGQNLQTVLNSAKAAAAEGSASLSTRDLRNHLMAIGQTDQAEARLNRVKVRFYWDRAGADVEHVRCLSSLSQEYTDIQAAGCDLARAVGGGNYAMLHYQHAARTFGNGHDVDQNFGAAIIEKAEAFYQAAGGAKAPSAIVALHAAVETFSAKKAVRQDEYSKATGRLAGVIQSGRDHYAAAGALLNPLYQGRVSKASIQEWDAGLVLIGHDLTEVESAFASLQSTGVTPAAERQALVDAIDAACVAGAAVGGSTAGAAEKLREAMTSYVSDSAANARKVGEVCDDGNDLTQLSKAMHDMAKSIIGNIRA